MKTDSSIATIRTRQFLKLWLLVALSGALLAACGRKVSGPAQWRAEIDQLTANDAGHPPPQHGVLFIGSSSIRMWTTLAGDFAGLPTVRRGFGGSTIPDSTFYADRIVIPYQPKLVVMYAGDNDVEEGHSPQRVIDDFKAFVARVRRALPGVAIAYISIKPSIARWSIWPQMHAANEGIANWARTQRDIRYVDVSANMLGPNGKPRPELFQKDGLHMKPAGYAIWITALKPVLAEYGFVMH